eukprot:COSAG02_NODE_1004_length_15275_cov_11.955917_10_plen_183_part_00
MDLQTVAQPDLFWPKIRSSQNLACVFWGGEADTPRPVFSPRVRPSPKQHSYLLFGFTLARCESIGLGRVSGSLPRCRYATQAKDKEMSLTDTSLCTNGRAHGNGALNVDGDERGGEGGRDAQPLRENTHRHASARQRHHISQLARPGGSCLPAAGAPSPYIVPIAAISAEITALPPPAHGDS